MTPKQVIDKHEEILPLIEKLEVTEMVTILLSLIDLVARGTGNRAEFWCYVVARIEDAIGPEVAEMIDAKRGQYEIN